MNIKIKKDSQKKLLKDEKIFNTQIKNGALPSPEDSRDYTKETVSLGVTEYPTKYRAPKTPILNQGCVGSCVAHACATAIMQNEKVIWGKYTNYSRGYIYANRLDTDHQGDGMFPRQALSGLHKRGDVTYTDFPYNENYPAIKRHLTDAMATLASEHAIDNYFRCYTIEDVKSTIMSRGGVIIAMPLYDNFSKIVSNPTSENKPDGSHAMILIGWVEDIGDGVGPRWICQNSWSSAWGDKGCCYIPMSYPISEMWGITIDTSKKPLTSNIFERICAVVKNGFTMLKVWFSSLSKK